MEKRRSFSAQAGLIICISIIIVCCKVPHQNYSSREREVFKDDTLMARIILQDSVLRKITTDWKKDSLGCMSLRNFEGGEVAVNTLHLWTRNREDIISVFGKPNIIDCYDPGLCNLTYYVDTRCYNHKVVDTLDHCWMDFLFQNDSLVFLGKSCN